MIITTTIPEAIAKLTQMEATLAEGRTAVAIKSAAKARIMLDGSIRARTPVGDSTPHLRDTTTSAASSTGPDSAEVTVWQTKTVPVGKSKVPVPLSKILRDGRKGGYFIRPTTKRALAASGYPHPFMISPNPKNYPGGMPDGKPNPYAHDAVMEAMPAIYSELSRIAAATMRAAVIEGVR